MRTNRTTQRHASTSTDLFRIEKSKEAVDISPNTLRSYADKEIYGRLRLNIYKVGKATFVSRAELETFIKNQHEKAAA